MAQYTGNFETGVVGNVISTSDAGSANAWNSVFDGGGAVSLRYASTPAYDARSAEAIFTTADHAYVAWTSSTLGTLTELWGRIYMRFSGLPVSDTPIVTGFLSASNAWYVVVRTTGLIQLQDTFGNPVANGTMAVNTADWSRIEFHVINSTTTGFIEAKLFNDANSNTPSDTIASDSLRNLLSGTDEIRFGKFGGNLNGRTVYWDNILVNNTGYPGPVPMPQILVPRHGIGLGRW